MVTFLLFGAVVATAAFALLSGQVVLYAMLSLFVVRPAAVALALVGTGMAWRTTLFLGWAGPRGLASIVYVVLVADNGAFDGQDTVVAVGSLTVLLSIVLHVGERRPVVPGVRTVLPRVDGRGRPGDARRARAASATRQAAPRPRRKRARHRRSCLTH